MNPTHYLRKFSGVVLLCAVLAMPGAALADPGWLEIDVTGQAPNRVVTYANFSSLALAHDMERATQFMSAPADSNTAALSRSLAQTRLWTIRTMRVFEGNEPTVQLRDVHAQWLSVDCSSERLFAIWIERIRKDRKHPNPLSAEAETYEKIATHRPLGNDERWQQVLIRNVCDQAPLRRALMGFACVDERVHPLGMECLPGIPDNDHLRVLANYAMKDPAQFKAVD